MDWTLKIDSQTGSETTLTMIWRDGQPDQFVYRQRVRADKESVRAFARAALRALGDELSRRADRPTFQVWVEEVLNAV